MQANRSPSILALISVAAISAITTPPSWAQNSAAPPVAPSAAVASTGPQAGELARAQARVAIARKNAKTDVNAFRNSLVNLSTVQSRVEPRNFLPLLATLRELEALLVRHPNSRPVGDLEVVKRNIAWTEAALARTAVTKPPMDPRLAAALAASDRAETLTGAALVEGRREALRLFETALGPMALDTISAHNNLAISLIEMKTMDSWLEANALAVVAAERARTLSPNRHGLLETAIWIRAFALSRLGRWVEAETFAAELVRLRIGDRYSADSDARERLVSAYVLLGQIKNYQARLEVSESVLRDAVAVARSLPPSQSYRLELALALASLSVTVVSAGGRDPEAISIAREALQIQQELRPVGHRDIATSLQNIATMMVDGTPEQISALREAVVAATGPLAANGEPVITPLLVTTWASLASALYNSGTANQEIEPLLRRVLAGRELLLGALHPETSNALDQLGVYVSDDPKRLSESVDLGRDAVRRFTASTVGWHPHKTRARFNLGMNELEFSEPAQAYITFRTAGTELLAGPGIKSGLNPQDRADLDKWRKLFLLQMRAGWTAAQDVAPR